jgi:predicted secreted hydrolase
MGVRIRRVAPWLFLGAATAVGVLVAGTLPAGAATTATTGGINLACSGAVAATAAAGPALSASAATQGMNIGTGVRIPQDEAPHADPEEWWYFTGHLWGKDPSGHLRCYGFEYTTFQLLDVAPVPVYFGNVAITDLNTGTFQYGFEVDSYDVPQTPNSFAVHTGDWSMSGGSGRDTMHFGIPGYTVDLQMKTTEKAALHGDNGQIPFGPLGSSKYYSWTSLLTGGTLVDHGVPITVSGLSWMDHQWGAFDFSTGAGWDWFSVQLSNGNQYMLYFIRDASGAIVERLGTQIDKTGKTTKLSPSSFNETTLGSWTSPATGITYSSGWRVTVPGGFLNISPRQLDQEVNLIDTPQGNAYWEGDSAVSGVINGKPVVGTGYTEINPTG